MTLVEHLTSCAGGSSSASWRSAPARSSASSSRPTHPPAGRAHPGPLYFTEPGGALILQLKLALMIGVALGSPVVLYQLWAFVAPGLTPRERRAARPWIPLALFSSCSASARLRRPALHGRLPARLPDRGRDRAADHADATSASSPRCSSPSGW
jgi:hypothetical protein